MKLNIYLIVPLNPIVALSPSDTCYQEEDHIFTLTGFILACSFASKRKVCLFFGSWCNENSFVFLLNYFQSKFSFFIAFLEIIKSGRISGLSCRKWILFCFFTRGFVMFYCYYWVNFTNDRNGCWCMQANLLTTLIHFLD